MNACGDLLTICAFASAESIVHEAIAQAHDILGFGENHDGIYS